MKLDRLEELFKVIEPIFPADTTTILTDEEDVLQRNPDVIHLITKGPFGEIHTRIDKGEKPDEQIIRISGANHSASRKGIVYVNGDNSFKEKVLKEINIIREDIYACTPDTD